MKRSAGEQFWKNTGLQRIFTTAALSCTPAVIHSNEMLRTMRTLGDWSDRRNKYLLPSPQWRSAYVGTDGESVLNDSFMDAYVITFEEQTRDK